MVQPTKGGATKVLASNYQYGGDEPPPRGAARSARRSGRTQGALALAEPTTNEEVYEEQEDEAGAFDAVDLEKFEEATIENWLADAVPEEWVLLKTRPLKVLIRGVTEAERQSIQKRAPKIFNKRTRQNDVDSEWVTTELVRMALLKPLVPTHDLLNRALAGDLAHIAEEVGRISGFKEAIERQVGN